MPTQRSKMNQKARAGIEARGFYVVEVLGEYWVYKHQNPVCVGHSTSESAWKCAASRAHVDPERYESE